MRIDFAGGEKYGVGVYGGARELHSNCESTNPINLQGIEFVDIPVVTAAVLAMVPQRMYAETPSLPSWCSHASMAGKSVGAKARMSVCGHRCLPAK